MSNKHKGKSRIEFTPEEIERLLLLVQEAIKDKSILEVCDSPFPDLLMKLNRGYHQFKAKSCPKCNKPMIRLNYSKGRYGWFCLPCKIEIPDHPDQ